MTATAPTRPLSDAQHSEAHAMIRALSITEWGKSLVEGLEDIRYFHGEGEAYDLGHGGRLVFGIDYYGEYGPRIGAVLLPSTKDSLFYETGDYLEEEVEGALFWDFEDDAPVLIPRVLGEWAAELVLTRSSVPVVECREAQPVACTIKGQEGASVTAPMSQLESLPGLVRDKWAHKKADEARVDKTDEDRYGNVREHHTLPGYEDGAVVVHGFSAGEISRMLYWTKRRDEDFWKTEGNLEWLKAALHWATGFSCFREVESLPYSEVVHRFETGDYWGNGEHLSESDSPEWERALMEYEEA